MLIIDSRRLIVLATMEATLAILIMLSYVPNIVSPILMLVCAALTFTGASGYRKAVVAGVQYVLALTIVHHLWIMSIILRQQERYLYVNDSHGAWRTVLVSIACIVFMEVVMLKRCRTFTIKLVAARPHELATLRILRRQQTGWAQRIFCALIFVLICTPAVARYLVLQHGGRLERGG
jgi:hypothetical protein